MHFCHSSAIWADYPELVPGVLAVDGIVPRNLIERPKQGFGVPVNELFEGPLQRMAEVELQRFCAETDLLDADEVARVMQSADGSKRWYLMNLAMWWRTFIA